MSRRFAGPLLAVMLLAGCGERAAEPPAKDGSEAATPQRDGRMNSIAERYVKLVLAVGQHDADYVDAYYGPSEWRQAAEAEKLPLDEIGRRARGLVAELLPLAPAPLRTDENVDEESELRALRHAFLIRQLRSLEARVGMLRGAKLPFDEESNALYDAVAPTLGTEHFQATLDELDRLLPGDGTVAERVEAYRQGFVIPRERLDAVFGIAINECRERTNDHVELPAGESFEVEYVTGKPWSAYNWYKGGFHSLIQVNTDLPITIDRAIDLACHEGYPGHHVYNALLEKHLVRDRGWVELSVYPLFSPQSLIAEGTANFGIEAAFPGEERVLFERDVLFPAAGLDPARAAEYYRVVALVDRLAYAGNEAARRYLDGEIGAEAAADWLERYALMSPERARQRVSFFDRYRSYVINYNLGEDLVRRFVESRGGTPDVPERRWEEFERLLSSPRLPSGLKP